MPATVADTLINRLIDAFPANRAYTVRDFSRDPMPGPLRDYLERRMAVRLEEIAHPGGDWIDADNHEVRAAVSAYRSALAHHLRIPASAWRVELALACRTVMSYLLRPAPTLTDLLFADDREDAAFEDIAEQFLFLPAYSYFHDVIAAYFEQKDLERISRERFAVLVRRIDHQMVRDFGTEDWMKLLDPLLEMVRGIPEFSGGLPVQALRIFLEEKGADDLVGRLEEHLQSQGTRFMPGPELRIFFDRSSEEPAEEPAVPEAESVDSPGPADKGDSSHRGSHVPLWKQFESGIHPATAHASPAASVGSENAPPRGTAEAQPLWKQFRGSEGPPSGRKSLARQESPRREDSPRRQEAWRQEESAGQEGSARRQESARREKHPEESSKGTRETLRLTRHAVDIGAPSDDLSKLERSVLGQRGVRNRDLFLRHLFSGSAGAYEDTLRKLNAAENWSEASQIIAREVFLKHQVNIYSDPAVAFTDAAEARFRS